MRPGCVDLSSDRHNRLLRSRHLPADAGRSGGPLRAALVPTLPLALLIFTAACTADPAPAASPPPAPTALGTWAPGPRAQLAALAAAAEDRHLTARYTLSGTGRADQTITVTGATDGSWRVDIPGGALSGAVDVSIVRTADGLYQCALSGAAPIGCVRVGGPDGHLPADADPRVQHPFLDWPDVLTDRQAPLAVSAAPQLPGARGQCFSVDSTSASLRPPLDVGIYCYDADGTLTGVRFTYGTLVLTGAPAAAPTTVSLPAPVTAGSPLPVAAPAGPASTAPG